mgnify:FL=1
MEIRRSFRLKMLITDSTLYARTREIVWVLFFSFNNTNIKHRDKRRAFRSRGPLKKSNELQDQGVCQGMITKAFLLETRETARLPRIARIAR